MQSITPSLLTLYLEDHSANHAEQMKSSVSRSLDRLHTILSHITHTSSPSLIHRTTMSHCSGADPSGLSFLAARFARDLREFAADSNSTFRIIHTVPFSPTPPSPTSPLTDLKTLYVLDSSFNPPTKAHLTIARNALLRDNGNRPVRVMFLLATENADKKPKPASFEDRLVMMSLCAEELRSSLNGETATSDGSSVPSDLSVDVAVTKHPFFMDKAMSIDKAEIYGDAQQVHLTGYDTIIRIFNSKYYPKDQKLRVLEPFLSRHRLRVCYRVSGGKEGDREAQEAYVEGIGDGSREDEGMKREWREMVELVNDAKDVEGVSSTDARRAAVEGDTEKLEGLIGKRVGSFVMERGLYPGNESVKKSYD